MPKTPDSEPQRDSFDLDRLRKLFNLMDKFGVTEVSLQNEEESWRIRRGPRQVIASPVGVPAPAPSAPAEPPAPAAPPATPAASPAPAAAPAGKTIDAPTVGTFYNRPSPEDEVFVGVGSVVKPDTVVCLIEAMKVFNQITAETSGRITEVLVENGDAVEFGQPLFRVEPA